MLSPRLKKPSVYISAFVLAALVFLYVFTLSPRSEQKEAIQPVMGPIEEEVSLTGTVQAARKTSLSFDRAGIIRTLPFVVGAEVGAGTVVASLYNDSETAGVAEYRALIGIAQAKLDAVKRGTRPEERTLKEAEVQKANVTLENTKTKTGSVLTDAYTAAEDALNRYADPLFSNDDTSAPKLTYASGTQEAIDAESARLSADASMQRLQSLLSGEASSAALETALKDVRTVQNLFVILGLTLRDGSTLDATTLADYRSRVTTARDALTSAVNSIQNQQNSLRDNAAELERALRTLDLARAKATPEALMQAEQELRQAEAKHKGAAALLEKTFLRAPFKGRISLRHVELGETVASGETVIEFFGTSGLVIEANVPEADIAKIAVGDEASVTLDAYGKDLVFTARLAKIDPSETKIEGVATYKTTLSLDSNDPRIRSGMTANVYITKTLTEDALLLPARAIVQEKGASYVTKLLPAGNTEKVEVTTGRRIKSGDVEILKGLSPADKVLISPAK